MKKSQFLCFSATILLFPLLSFSQLTIFNPQVNFNTHSDHVNISKIVLNSKETIIDLAITSSFQFSGFKVFPAGSEKAFYIEDENKNKIAYLRKVIGVPVGKKVKLNPYSYDPQIFTLVFDPIKPTIKVINLKEGNLTEKRGFHFYSIKLSPDSELVSNQIENIISDKKIIELGIKSAFFIQKNEKIRLKSEIIEPLKLEYISKESDKDFSFFSKMTLKDNFEIEVLSLALDSRNPQKGEIVTLSLVIEKKNEEINNNATFINTLIENKTFVRVENSFFLMEKNLSGELVFVLEIQPIVYSKALAATFRVIQNDGINFDDLEKIIKKL